MAGGAENKSLNRECKGGEDKEVKSHWMSLRDICFLERRGSCCTFIFKCPQRAGSFEVRWLSAGCHVPLKRSPPSNDIKACMMDSTWCHRLWLSAMWLSRSAKLEFVEGYSERRAERVSARGIYLLDEHYLLWPLSMHISRWIKP